MSRKSVNQPNYNDPSSSHTLYTRQGFKEAVLERAKNLCVVCKKPAVDAHHIIDRKCWSDGGYYLDNGVALCSDCHWKAEKGEFTPDYLRDKADIEINLLPLDFDPGKSYDKWGKEI